jgi:hypothetical protein
LKKVVRKKEKKGETRRKLKKLQIAYVEGRKKEKEICGVSTPIIKSVIWKIKFPLYCSVY